MPGRALHRASRAALAGALRRVSFTNLADRAHDATVVAEARRLDRCTPHALIGRIVEILAAVVDEQGVVIDGGGALRAAAVDEQRVAATEQLEMALVGVL